ncbi:MAG TPA: hypothetical protein VFG54_21650 [Prolixibacteraceae bacterium]|nr:hypothetical protein [Prolixibacteraceae bacterium]
MSSAGHIADMLTRIRNNEALKKGKRAQRRKLNELFHKDGIHGSSNPVRDTNISNEALEEINVKMRNTSARESRSAQIYTLIISALILLAIMAIIYWGFII